MEPKSATKINTFSIEFPNSTEMKTRGNEERELYKFSLKCSFSRTHIGGSCCGVALSGEKSSWFIFIIPVGAEKHCFQQRHVDSDGGERRRREGNYFINGSYENVVRVSLEIKVVCGNGGGRTLCISPKPIRISQK